MDKPALLSAERQRLLELRLKGSAKAPQAAGRIPAPAAGRPPALSAAQHQMWLIEQMNPGNGAYNIPVAYRLAGELDAGALEDGFNQIIQRHEAWRTTFGEVDGEPVQQIHPTCKIQIGLTDLQHLPTAKREEKLSTLVAEEAVRPFDLRQLPLLRVSLFKLGPVDHVLLVNVHHIVADGLSLRLMFDELDDIYRAVSAGGVPALPELAAQYSSFAAWQAAELSQGGHARQADYWQRQLQGELPVLEMATDKPRPVRQSFNGSNVNFTISKSLAQSLTRIGNQEGATFFATIFATFEVLLLRHSGGGEVIIGTPVARRPLPEFEHLIGNFLNVVALRCDPAGNPTFTELVRRCRETALLALSHADVPFETVVQSLRSHRDPSRNPVFQALMQILPPVHARIGDLQVSRFDFEMRFSQVDLALHLFEEPDGGFFGQLQFCTDLFAPETIERLALNFVHLLNQIAQDPLQRILEIPVLAPAEKNRLLVEWNRTAADFGEEKTLQALIAEQAALRPDSIAVECEGRQLTYRALDQRANQLAQRLRPLDVGPDVLVGISLERSLDLVVGLLGILKAGGAYVPIDPEYPRERRAFMLEDAAVPVLLTQHKLAAGLPPHHAKVICLDTDWESMARENDRAPVDRTTAESLAYMIYTSGSTGQPKGALNHHRGIVNRLLWMQARYQLTPSDAVLQKTPFSFDVSVWEFFWPLLIGARIVLARPGGHQDLDYLIQLIQKQRISVMHFVPPMLRIFLDQPGVSDCTSLRHVICSGEALPHDLQEEFFAKLPCQLHNLYGPTEAAVDVTHWTCQRATDANVVPIGRPVANTQCYILDALLQPVPTGVPGELYLGGVQVGRGYHNRPELTAEKFIADPFSAQSGARLYRTGDLCRHLPDGNIDYLGRMDHQVKIRGFRIESGEIEATLTQHPAVQEAVVVAREDAPGDKRLIAYLVSTSARPSISDLRSHLKTRLPDYMVPAGFVFLDALPLSANGKVDRKALPLPESTRSDLTLAFIAPRNQAEEHVAEVWRDILKLEQVGVNDDFFLLGGHSLLAIQLMGRIREKFGVEVPARQLFNTPTIAGLAGFIAAKMPTVAPAGIEHSLVCIQKGAPERRPFFLVAGGWGGEIEFLVYANLTRQLGADLPLYGLKARGADAGTKPHEKVEEMAADYLSEVRAFQPHGPYLLGGECVGGIVAYEMARQLVAAGEEVALLVLLDTERPTRDTLREFVRTLNEQKRERFWEVRVAQPTREHIENLKQLPVRKQFGYIWRRTVGRAQHRRSIAAGGDHAAAILQERKLVENYPKVLMQHSPGPYSGKVTLLVDETAFKKLGHLGWDEVKTGGLEVHVLPGDHLSYIRAHAGDVAACLRELIERAEPSASHA